MEESREVIAQLDRFITSFHRLKVRIWAHDYRVAQDELKRIIEKTSVLLLEAKATREILRETEAEARASARKLEEKFAKDYYTYARLEFARLVDEYGVEPTAEAILLPLFSEFFTIQANLGKSSSVRLEAVPDLYTDEKTGLRFSVVQIEPMLYEIRGYGSREGMGQAIGRLLRAMEKGNELEGVRLIDKIASLADGKEQILGIQVHVYGLDYFADIALFEDGILSGRVHADNRDAAAQVILNTLETDKPG